jgi:hypothetical protein
LKPNQPYLFTVDLNCPKCVEMAAIYESDAAPAKTPAPEPRDLARPGDSADILALWSGYPIDEIRRARALLDAPKPQGVVDALNDLYQAYVRLLEAGMDRITGLGGTCDPVDAMEKSDPYLIRARRAIAALQHPQPAPNETRVTDDAQSEKWLPIKPHGAPYYGIHTETGATIAGTASGLGERDAKRICALHNGELCEADDLIRALGFKPERFRTECGFINHHKLAAAIKHPDAYTGLAVKAAPQPAEPVTGWAWRDINECPETDDLFWFRKGEVIDGPRCRKYDDSDYWTHFATCEAPAIAALRQPVTLREVTIDDAIRFSLPLATLREILPHGIPVTGSEGERG